ncbi:MAG: WGR domain-containing protein, partial [Bacillota bacterium]|nr:WGR domain-containing protein [Bacillota bacterium]
METLLVFKNEESHEFWKINVLKNKYTISFGKVGATGAVKMKEFGSSEMCLKEAYKLIRAKIKMGYQPAGFSGQIIKENPMTREGFWKLIDQVKKNGYDLDEQMEMLIEQLAKKPIKEIVRFDSIFNDYY